jgi:hypothetical protein
MNILEALQNIAAYILGYFFAMLIPLLFIGFGVAIFVFFYKGSKGRRRKFSEWFNTKEQFQQHLDCLNFIEQQFGITRVEKYSTYKGMKWAHTAKGWKTLAHGEVYERKIEVKTGLAGNEFMTRIESDGAFLNELEACTSKGALRVLGKRLDIKISKPIIEKRGLFVIIPNQERVDERLKNNIRLWDDLYSFLNLKPDLFNISPMIVEFYEKKITIEPTRAYLHDYGLIRDAQYLGELIKAFAAFINSWERFPRATIFS